MCRPPLYGQIRVLQHSDLPVEGGYTQNAPTEWSGRLCLRSSPQGEYSIHFYSPQGEYSLHFYSPQGEYLNSGGWI